MAGVGSLGLSVDADGQEIGAERSHDAKCGEARRGGYHRLVQ
jgi:hypothetical protein